MTLPTGIITIWSGAIIDIPAGWTLCDGNNGTPDLRDRFLLGAGDTFAPDDAAGNPTHTHTGTTDGHRHDLLTDATIATGSGFARATTLNTDDFTTDPANHLPPYYALAYIMKT